MPSSETLEEKSRIVDLLEIYGGLLTERQRTFIQQYYAEDLSYGEISAAYEISRQAVHDAIGHGKKSLERFESHLQLGARPSSTGGAETETPAEGERVDTARARQLVAKAQRLVGDDLLYDTSKLQKVLVELKQVLGGD